MAQAIQVAHRILLVELQKLVIIGKAIIYDINELLITQEINFQSEMVVEITYITFLNLMEILK